MAGDTLYFAATDATGAQRLWSWKGITATKVAAASGIGTPQEMIAFNGAPI